MEEEEKKKGRRGGGWGSESFLRSLEGILNRQIVLRDDISRPEAPLEAESLRTEVRMKPENSEKKCRLCCLIKTVQRRRNKSEKHGTMSVTDINTSRTLNITLFQM